MVMMINLRTDCDVPSYPPERYKGRREQLEEAASHEGKHPTQDKDPDWETASS